MSVNLQEWVGCTLSEVNENYDEIFFTFDNGKQYKMHHYQDCCESVYVESVVGDWNDLIGTPLTLCEESSNYEENGEYGEETQWTFYKFATVKGFVDVRWLGTSNGYYGTSVDVSEI